MPNESDQQLAFEFQESVERSRTSPIISEREHDLIRSGAGIYTLSVARAAKADKENRAHFKAILSLVSHLK